MWWLTKLTGSATVLATATPVGLLGEILLAPIAGAFVDRWNRRIVLTLSSPVDLVMAGPVSDSLGLQVWYVIGGVLTSAVTIALLFVPAVVSIEQTRAPVPGQP